MILCCGEALIDFLPEADDIREGFRPHAGGAVFNTAIGLGRLGAETGYFAQMSHDMFGDLLRDALDASKVDHSLCPTSVQPTTLAFVKLTNGNAAYTFYDERSAGRTLSEGDLPALPDAVAALHLGAISLIPEPCGSAFEALALREATTRVISLDPNIRPGFISDEDAHRSRIERLLAVSDIVKVSDEDMAWIAPDLDEDGFVRRTLKGGAAVVTVTRGGNGATGYAPDFQVDVGVPKVDVVDTVGAGDTFNSGLLDAFARADVLTKAGLRSIDKETFRDGLEAAASVAAVTVSRAGANPPWREELI